MENEARKEVDKIISNTIQLLNQEASMKNADTVQDIENTNAYLKLNTLNELNSLLLTPEIAMDSIMVEIIKTKITQIINTL